MSAVVGNYGGCAAGLCFKAACSLTNDEARREGVKMASTVAVQFNTMLSVSPIRFGDALNKKHGAAVPVALLPNGRNPGTGSSEIPAPTLASLTE
jgi:hypothetical protein